MLTRKTLPGGIRAACRSGTGRTVVAGLDDGEDAAADFLREVGEFEPAFALARGEEVFAGGDIGVERIEIAADDDATAAELPEDVRDHVMIADQLIVQPGVADGEAHFLEHVEEMSASSSLA